MSSGEVPSRPCSCRYCRPFLGFLLNLFQQAVLCKHHPHSQVHLTMPEKPQVQSDRTLEQMLTCQCHSPRFLSSACELRSPRDFPAASSAGGWRRRSWGSLYCHSWWWYLCQSQCRSPCRTSLVLSTKWPQLSFHLYLRTRLSCPKTHACQGSVQPPMPQAGHSQQNQHCTVSTHWGLTESED